MCIPSVFFRRVAKAARKRLLFLVMKQMQMASEAHALVYMVTDTIVLTVKS
jgi:hypothetical protein